MLDLQSNEHQSNHIALAFFCQAPLPASRFHAIRHVQKSRRVSRESQGLTCSRLRSKKSTWGWTAQNVNPHNSGAAEPQLSDLNKQIRPMLHSNQPFNDVPLLVISDSRHSLICLRQRFDRCILVQHFCELITSCIRTMWTRQNFKSFETKQRRTMAVFYCQQHCTSLDSAVSERWGELG